MAGMPGGYSGQEAPSQEVAALAAALKRDVEATLGVASPFPRFEPVAATQQVVAGMNYRVKARALTAVSRVHVAHDRQPWALTRALATHPRAGVTT